MMIIQFMNNMLDIVELLVGILVGALCSWLFTRAYYLKAKQDQESQVQKAHADLTLEFDLSPTGNRYVSQVLNLCAARDSYTGAVEARLIKWQSEFKPREVATNWFLLNQRSHKNALGRFHFPEDMTADDVTEIGEWVFEIRERDRANSTRTIKFSIPRGQIFKSLNKITEVKASSYEANQFGQMRIREN